MIEVEIDGKKIETAEGSMIIQAADAAGIYIPRFCYHRKLSIAANCRMCLVEVEKSKKPLPACATPITPGMKVFTKSKLAIDAQVAVMEFLLINHPLDCPICDQGGECELQDLSLGYGKAVSRYDLAKRAIWDENLGPLISTEMTRCIQCTRCVRFGQEIAGLPELGTIDRGEDLRIRTYVQHTMQSELSGNIIDICPVGALTSKPFRFRARAWELNQSASIAPHDCIGSNIYLHARGFEYKNYREVMRVVPRDNEAINENWLSDRDRFSYEGIHHEDRLTKPHIKTNGQLVAVDWTTALNFACERLKEVKEAEGPDQIAALASPNSTLEEFYLLQKLLRAYGSSNIDHRIRETDFRQQERAPLTSLLGFPIPDIEKMENIVLIGSNVRHEQPMASHRVRKASQKGSRIFAINSIDYDFNFSLTEKCLVSLDEIPQVLAELLNSLAPKTAKESLNLLQAGKPRKQVQAMKKQLKAGSVLFLLGPQALHHPDASLIKSLVYQIAKQVDGKVGYLPEGANSTGAWLAGAVPHRGPAGIAFHEPGLSAQEMFEDARKAYLLLNLEPEYDCAKPALAIGALERAKCVIALTPFISESQKQYVDVFLPIAPFGENYGTFVNVAGEWQSFGAATEPADEARPAWKVLRVLGNLLQLEGFDYVTSNQVLDELKFQLENAQAIEANYVLPCELPQKHTGLRRYSEWHMYRTDNLVRRAPSLQAWLENQEYANAVRINAKLAKELEVRSGELVTAIQNGKEIMLPVLIDDRIIGDNTVFIPAAMTLSEGFGENYGTITLSRGALRD